MDHSLRTSDPVHHFHLAEEETEAQSGANSRLQPFSLHVTGWVSQEADSEMGFSVENIF